jgi:hypothetical protein
MDEKVSPETDLFMRFVDFEADLEEFAGSLEPEQKKILKDYYCERLACLILDLEDILHKLKVIANLKIEDIKRTKPNRDKKEE